MEGNITSTTDFSTVFCHHCDPTLQTLKTVLSAAAVLGIFVGSIAGNLFVCLVFYKRPSLLTISNRFILNLTVCNVLNTVFVMPFVFVTNVSRQWIFGTAWCQATGFLMNAIFGASTLTLVVISADRYCAVVTPLHYNMRMTLHRSTWMISGVWLLAVVSAFPPLVGWNRFEYQEEKYSCTVLWRSSSYTDRTYTLFLSLLCFVLPLLVMVWAYVVIFRAARDNSERTRRNSVVPNATEEPSQTPLRYGRRRSSTAPIILSRKLSTSSRTSSFLWHRDEWKAAVTSMVVVSTFVVCWLPYFVIIAMESVLHEPTVIHPVMQGVAIFLALSSCAFNPIVYVFRSKVARQELRSILHARRGKPQASRSPTQARGSEISHSHHATQQQLPQKTVLGTLTETALTSVITVRTATDAAEV